VRAGGPSGDPVPFEPLHVRRLVTGVDGSGRSGVLSDGDAPTADFGARAAGMQVVELWQTGSTPPDLTGGDAAATPHGLEPPPGGCNWRLVVFPDRYDPDFLVRTDTLDLMYIVSGQVIVDVGDDATSMVEVRLGTGDAIVALGNVHHWRNPGPGPCVAVATMVSALDPAVGR
jgi:mannose-6-phosphate isomerase-like protein (cupin superfamily)